jgi:ATP-dependent DNA helicase RecQ
MVFSDAALLDMARKRPTTLEGFAAVFGVGGVKCKTYGPLFCETIRQYCADHDLETDAAPDVHQEELFTEAPKSKRTPNAKMAAMELFRRECSIEEVSEQIRRAPSTVMQYLEEFIERQGITDPYPWVANEVVERVTRAAPDLGIQRLSPIYQALDGSVSYPEIRISLACLRNREQAQR